MPIEVDCGCVTTEVLWYWVKKAYNDGLTGRGRVGGGDKVNRMFLLMAEFETTDIPLEKIAEKYLGISIELATSVLTLASCLSQASGR
ncbi:Uncharacterised protein [Klebsiella pneumoniae]|uniref:Uncharacterized protein n=1 Tax=Klebsiella pneumoniae TaxID=573 RepID=A0A378FX34_KLEPN|nr:Uncharacterised protein [Klebsiella pneumoniae]